MKNLNNILLLILTIGLILLYVLHFSSKSGSADVVLNPNAKDLSKLGSAKVVFVNTDTLFDRYEKFKNIEKDMETQQKQAESSMQGKIKALESEYMKLMQMAQAGQINPQQGQAQEQALVKRKQAIEAESQQYMKTLAEKSKKANQEIRNEIKAIIEKNRAQYNCDYVLGYQTDGALFYVDPKYDITQHLLKELNQK